MSVDKAKEFLIDVAEDASAGERIQARYLEALVDVSKDLGYDLSTDDLSIAIEEMSGLGAEDEVEGFGLPLGNVFLDSLTWSRGPASMGIIANPLGLMGGFRPPRLPR